MCCPAHRSYTKVSLSDPLVSPYREEIKACSVAGGMWLALLSLMPDRNFDIVFAYQNQLLPICNFKAWLLPPPDVSLQKVSIGSHIDMVLKCLSSQIP